MKTVVLYAYPPQSGSLSIQGDILYRGMKKNGEEVIPCYLSGEFQKEWIYRSFKPDIAIGIGCWDFAPDIIIHPQKFNIIPVPWLIADGWVANYHEVISSLPLVFVTSEWVKKIYARDGVNISNFKVAHIGLETDLFKPIAKSDPKIKTIRKMLGVQDDELMILTVGGDVTSKGAQEILKALKKVDEEFKKWKYICKVWGGKSVDDHYEEERCLIEKLGQSKDKVKYIEGELPYDFMAYLLNACDIYAAPSRLEGYGMVQVEAQACGIPVISINEMGPKETIIHGKTGFLANVAETVDLTSELALTSMGFERDSRIMFDEPKTFAYRANVDETADYLLQLLTNQELRQRMGQAAQEHASENFEYRQIAKKIACLIKQELNLS